MQEQIRERIKGLSDEDLVEQFTGFKEEYTEEAIELMQKEIDERGIDVETFQKAGQDEEAAERPRYRREDFEIFEHSFSHLDLLLAQSILRESQIPFFVDLPAQSSVLPLEAEVSQRYTIHVLRERHQDAREALGEHFVAGQHGFERKDVGVKDRLRSFSFHEVFFTEEELEEEVGVKLGAGESQPLVAYAKRLLQEADAIEQKGERVLFYYDSLEPLIQALSASGEQTLTRADLLTILEILQIYCDEESFPENLLGVAETVLQFLSES